MGWFYFKIEIINNIDVARTLHGNEKNVIKCILLPNITNNNEIYYTEITNNWITLNKNGLFEVHDNLNSNLRLLNIVIFPLNAIQFLMS